MLQRESPAVVRIRLERGVFHCYLQGVLQAEFALAVAVAAKAVYIKIPKVGEDSKQKTDIVAASKKHIECAKVDKALCAYVLLLAHVSLFVGVGAI